MATKQKNGTITLVEIQRYYHENMPERFLSEVASRYVQQSQSGKTMSEKYSGFVNVVGLILLDEISLNRNNSQLISHYEIMDKKTHQPYPAEATMSWIVIKLTEELQEKHQKIHSWGYFLRTGKILADSPKYIAEAYQMLEAKKWSEQEIEIQRRIDKAELIGRGIRSFARKEGLKEGKVLGLKEGKIVGLKEGQKQGLQKGLKQGIQRGINQGAQDKAMEVARNFLSMGLSLEQISKGTGLSIDKIKQLQD
jgi:predicted transposase/invertase (TIGR01784 family)